MYNCHHVIMCSILNLQVRVCIILTFVKSILTIAHFCTHPLTLGVARVLALFCKSVSTIGQKPCKITHQIDTHWSHKD
jgi:hypothetical protein